MYLIDMLRRKLLSQIDDICKNVEFEEMMFYSTAMNSDLFSTTMMK
jgi:hypothetical protein